MGLRSAVGSCARHHKVGCVVVKLIVVLLQIGDIRRAPAQSKIARQKALLLGLMTTMRGSVRAYMSQMCKPHIRCHH